MMRSIIVILSIAVSASASAAEFDYSYLSIGYGMTDYDDVNVDGDGFNIAGSYAINDRYHVFAGYSSADLDGNIDASGFGAGLGYHTGLSDTVDLVAGVSYEYVELDASGFGSVDDSGLGLGIGLRIAASDMLELNAGISYVDLSDSGSDTGFSAAALYNFTEAFSLGVGGSWSDDSSSYSVNGRFYFGE